MLAKLFATGSLILTVFFVPLLGQSPPDRPKPSAVGLAQEFPVTMKQNVVAGKTPVGTKVEAKLTIATLFEHVVIPMDAIFSGEVVESQAKTESTSSHLAIRMDSVRWKTGSKPVTLYLTNWYYPRKLPTDERSNEPSDGPFGRNPYGSGMPIPTPDPNGPGLGPSEVSDTRIIMKDVDSTKRSDGSLGLVSSRLNLKLDKTTTYVLATDDLKRAR